MDKAMNDPTSPNHYKSSSVECIEAIKASMSPEEYQGYLKGNAMKYLWRYKHKNGLEDLKKAQIYVGWLVTELSCWSDEVTASHSRSTASPADESV